MNIIDKISQLVSYDTKTIGIFFMNRDDAENNFHEIINNRDIRIYIKDVNYNYLSFRLGDCNFRLFYQDMGKYNLQVMQFTEVIFDDDFSQEYINTILPLKRG